ncbi:unnamed protein product [Rangifer tarandus platyrhynchus]|uniref:Uncharacterized protein n=1 Tax=Rangifer tarandus platyrhynchus TaxID=3082113 RepID=A0ABN8XVE6_RANTA|nr:unnamed protein product [Rangifer tarandus platyrhynchus]
MSIHHMKDSILLFCHPPYLTENIGQRLLFNPSLVSQPSCPISSSQTVAQMDQRKACYLFLPDQSAPNYHLWSILWERRGRLCTDTGQNRQKMKALRDWQNWSLFLKLGCPGSNLDVHQQINA